MSLGKRVVVVKCLSKMRGLTKAQLFSTADGNTYVVKSQNNPFGPSILINEMIGAELMRRLDLPIPPFTLIEMCRGTSGEVHFGSRYAGKTDRTAVYDCLPDTLLKFVDNADVFAGSFVFDTWVVNTDVRNIIFTRTAPDGSTARSFTAHLIDNSHLFGGPAWNFRETTVTGVTFSRVAYDRISDWNALNPWIERICAIAQPHVIGDIIAGLPEEWLCCDSSAKLEYIGQQLMYRALTLKSRLKAHISANRRLLPNWTGGEA